MRPALRLLGLALVIAGFAMLAVLVVAGPDEVAGWMGQSCSRGTGFRRSETCTWQDVALLWWLIPAAILGGIFLRIYARDPSKGPLTLDFSRRG